MTCSRFVILFFLTCFVIANAFCQIKLPTFDAEVKLHQNLIPGGGDNNGDLEFAETTNLYAGAHVQLGQHIAIGAFYSRSLRGIAASRYNEGNLKYDALSLQKGLDVRFSTGRAKNWRQYLVVQYSTLEIIQDREVFRLADKANTFGASIGLMRRLSNRLYLNVIEIGLNAITSKVFWFGDSNADFYFNAKMGVGYNIGKRK